MENPRTTENKQRDGIHVYIHCRNTHLHNKRSSFTIGIGRLFDFQGVLNTTHADDFAVRHDDVERSFERDKESLRGDWQIIGDDLKHVFLTYGREKGTTVKSRG